MISGKWEIYRIWKSGILRIVLRIVFYELFFDREILFLISGALYFENCFLISGALYFENCFLISGALYFENCFLISGALFF